MQKQREGAHKAIKERPTEINRTASMPWRQPARGSGSSPQGGSCTTENKTNLPSGLFRIRPNLPQLTVATWKGQTVGAYCIQTNMELECESLILWGFELYFLTYPIPNILLPAPILRERTTSTFCTCFSLWNYFKWNSFRSTLQWWSLAGTIA